MKGIVLAGGSGTRLFPLTYSISKQILPVYDKPLIFYPISVLMLAGIRDIAIVSSPRDIKLFENLLGDGTNYGVDFTYLIQEQPKGIADGILVAKDFISDQNCCLILGDNIFFGYQFTDMLRDAKENLDGATIFSTFVNNPSDFGVVELDKDGHIISIDEKPSNPRSNLAITGLYFYNNSVVDIVESIKPSERGELEITDVNKIYFEQNLLKVLQLGRGFAWLDTGTNDSMQAAGDFVSTIQKRQGLQIACLEEIAFKNGWIDKEILSNQIKKYINSDYGRYLQKLIV
ncbi:MAG: glucose-1-phosphate thymidylyltransferase RfbA [Pseudomonadota bacterium]|nr:glucose-1-phosphate thymidylyltransferase RfbA [Pseudomonadota bacterium]|tara:strand:- start:34055 stop:34918 length:864 start_codon:yes stop_codon:yes gene_type:complete